MYERRTASLPYISPPRTVTSIVAQLLAVRPRLIDVTVHIFEWTALHLAAENGHETIVAMLMPSIGVTDSQGRTALHFAARGGHDPIVAQLLAQHPDLIDEPADKESAVFEAAKFGHATTAALLIAHKPSLRLEHVGHSTALHAAAEFGHQEVVALLLDHKPELLNVCVTLTRTLL